MALASGFDPTYTVHGFVSWAVVLTIVTVMFCFIIFSLQFLAVNKQLISDVCTEKASTTTLQPCAFYIRS
jgi:hypothetical protein